jgi:Outer membrane protein beta-barrel domain
MTYFRETSLTRYSTYCGIAVAFVCTTAGSLRAQELQSSVQKQYNTILSASTRLPLGQDKGSKYLKTEPIVAQQNIDRNNISSNFTPNVSKGINYSWTSVDSLSPQSLQSREIKTPITVARQPSMESSPTENIPQPSTQISDKDLQKNTDSENRSTLPNRFYIGPDFFRRNYSEEEFTPGFKSDEFGTLYGVQATYDYVKGNSIYFGLGFRYGGGKTNYDGGLQDDSGNIIAPLKSKTNNSFLNLEGRLGYTFQPGGRKGRLLLSPFVGLGYHNWDRNISSTLTPVPGVGQVQSPELSEVYSWGYVGPGFHAEYKVSRKFDIGLNAKLMFMFGNSFNLETKDSVGRSVQGSGNLGNNLQYEIEIPLTFHLVDKPKTGIDLKVVPYYRSQDIARGPLFTSTDGNGRFEPASNTSVYGVTAGIQFRF